MAARPLRVRIEAEGADGDALRALARSGGLVMAEEGESADLLARPADSRRSPSALRTASGAASARPPVVFDAARRSLSRRELEILDYLVDGWSNAEIASALRVKVRTVRFHLEGIYAKLGVARRGEAVREALRLGLLRFDA